MKVVAIFDKPIGCHRCPMMSKEMACNLVRKPFDEARVLQIRKGCEGRPLWCPLRELPAFKMDWNDGNSYEAGWNDALDVIGG